MMFYGVQRLTKLLEEAICITIRNELLLFHVIMTMVTVKWGGKTLKTDLKTLSEK